jgi:hypothetical protein
MEAVALLGDSRRRRAHSWYLQLALIGLVLLLTSCSDSTSTVGPSREMAAEEEAAALNTIEGSFRIDPAWVVTRSPSGTFGGPSFMAEPDPDSGNRFLVWVVANRTLPSGYTPEQWVTARIQSGLDVSETAQDATQSPKKSVTVGGLDGFTTEVSAIRGAGTGQPLQARFDAVFGSEYSFVFYVENELEDRDWMRWQFGILTENVEFPTVEHPEAQDSAGLVMDKGTAEEAFESATSAFSHAFGAPDSAPEDYSWHRDTDAGCEDRYLRWELGSVHDAVPALENHVLDMRAKGFKVDRRSSSLDDPGIDYLSVATSDEFDITAFAFNPASTTAWIDWLEQNAGLVPHGLSPAEHGWLELQLNATSTC